jgi:hypothetical protein
MSADIFFSVDQRNYQRKSASSPEGRVTFYLLFEEPTQPFVKSWVATKTRHKSPFRLCKNNTQKA